MSGSLADWLAWLERTCGAKPCICRYEWKGLGNLYGSSMGKGWVRMSTEPECLEHGTRAAWQMCTIDDLIPGESPCQRLALWEWQPDSQDHPYFLCNFHAEPLTAEMMARMRELAP